jgi:hypothetical protein
MRWSVLTLLGALAIVTLNVTTAPIAMAAGPKDYAILIISRQTLQVSTSCEIGVFISDQLVTRLYQEEDTSLNLPPGEVSVRLKRLAAETPGCAPSGITSSPATHIKLHAGDVVKYAIAPGPYGLYLKPAPIEY